MVNNLISSAKKTYHSELIGSLVAQIRLKEMFRIVQILILIVNLLRNHFHMAVLFRYWRINWSSSSKIRSASSDMTFSSEDNSSQVTDLKPSNVDRHSGKLESGKWIYYLSIIEHYFCEYSAI